MMPDPEKDDLAHPHDLLVRTVLGDTDIAANFFKHYLAPELAATLDFSSLKREADDSVGANLTELIGDLRFSGRFKGSGKELKVYFFLEHQSRPDHFIAFRILEYVCAAYRQMFSALKKGEHFPYPLIVVLHHGRRPWKKIPQMRDLIDLPPGVPSDILNLPIALIDAAALPLDNLRGHPMVCALLDSLQSASEGRLAKRAGGVFGRLQSVVGDGRLKGWATALATYYGAIEGYAQESVDTLQRAFTTLLGKREAEKMTVTIAEHYRREGEARGIAEGEARGIVEGEARGIAKGKAEGKAIGKAEGKIESIMMFLELRFGRVPASTQKKLAGLTDALRIDEMLRLAATCGSLKEFQKAL